MLWRVVVFNGASGGGREIGHIEKGKEWAKGEGRKRRGLKEGDTTFMDWTEVIISGGSRIRGRVPVCPRNNIRQILVSTPSGLEVTSLY